MRGTAPVAAGPPDGGPGGSASALTIAGIAALLSSACCVLPLLLVLLGISGSWISQLHGFEPWSPYLAGLAVVALGLAGWRIFRWPSRPAAQVCDGPQGADACSTGNSAARRWFWVVVALTCLPLLVPVVAPLFY